MLCRNIWGEPISYTSNGTKKYSLSNLVCNNFPNEVVVKGRMWMLFEDFSVSVFSLNNGVLTLHEIFHLNITHHCTTRWIPLKLVYAIYAYGIMRIDINKNNRLTSSVQSMINIETGSYIFPCITIWISGPDGLVTMQFNIRILHQKFMLWTRHFQV